MPALKRNKKQSKSAVNTKRSAINLMPKDVRISEGVRSKAKKVKQIAVSSVIFFIVANVSLLLLNFYFNNKYQEAESEKKQLLANITALEGTEQRLVLLRDRIGKIQDIIETRNIDQALPTQKETLNKMEQVEFNEVLLDESIKSFSVKSNSTRSIQEYLESIEQLPYQNLSLKNIAFNDTTGFVAEFSYNPEKNENTEE